MDGVDPTYLLAGMILQVTPCYKTSIGIRTSPQLKEVKTLRVLPVAVLILAAVSDASMDEFGNGTVGSWVVLSHELQGFSTIPGGWPWDF